MVLGLRSKSRKVVTVQVDYIIHLQEVKPWPPSQSLRSLRSIVLQWENGDRSSGSTNPVAPSVAEGRIEFNESFKLHATLTKEASRGHGSGQFHKNLLEFSLYEPKRDKAAKGQLLASTAVDLAEHAILKEAVMVGLPLNYKRSYRNAANSMLYVKIQPYDKEGSTSSSRGSLSKEASLDRDGSESVSALMTGEYANEAEIASFTDDDVSSSHSSLNQNFPSPGKQAFDENVPEATNKSEGLNDNFASASLPVKPEVQPYASNHVHNGSLPESLIPRSPSDLESSDNADSVVSDTPQRSPTHISVDSDSSSIYSTSEMLEGSKQEHKVSKIDVSVEKDGLLQQVKGSGEKSVTENNINNDTGINVTNENDLPKEKLDLASVSEHKPEVNQDENLQDRRDASDEIARTHPAHKMMEVNTGEKSGEANEIESSTDRPENQSIESAPKVVHTPVLRPHFRRHTTKELPHEMSTVGQRLISEKVNGLLRSDVSKTRKLSVRSNLESPGGFRYPANDQCAEDVKETDVQDVYDAGSTSYTDDTSLCSDQVNHVPGNNKTNSSDDKVRELELKVEMLEAELREAAAIEAGLYCVVAAHGSSAQKVHTPARRLSRLYIHASKHWSPERKASAARSSVSGLFLAAKACGNDVPRLTFWLSNSVVLRAVTAQSIGYSDHPISVDHYSAPNGSEVMPKRRASSLKWESTQKKEFSFTEDMGNWEDPNTFMSALERIEAWIFSRIVESIWWQTFTPHMQMINESSEPKAVGSQSKKSYGRRPSLGDQKQANSSIEIWKRAFKDACERLCPVRAGGHECGCLPMLARMIMEQCVARLDVAMFNAILRESDDDIPNNPLSDPISDSKVLPIPSGKLSFGAGAQLKNAIGNWSRWLTDLFGMDEDDSPQDENDQESDRPNLSAPFMSFRLLYALSDLLMLPKDMLLERTIRKEVCPTFSSSVIKRILNSFQPDEFCPDPIPDAVLEALDYEEPLDDGEEGIRNFPCDASPVNYSSPSIDLIESIVGDVQSPSMLRRSVSSVIRKCHTSDDELDELDSPLNSVIIEKSTATAQSKRNTVRYQLLREVWRENN